MNASDDAMQTQAVDQNSVKLTEVLANLRRVIEMRAQGSDSLDAVMAELAQVPGLAVARAQVQTMRFAVDTERSSLSRAAHLLETLSLAPPEVHQASLPPEVLRTFPEQLRMLAAEMDGALGILKPPPQGQSRTETVRTFAPPANTSTAVAESEEGPEADSKAADSQGADSQEVNSQEVNSQEVNSQEVNSQEMSSQEVNSQEVNSQEVNSQEVSSQEMILDDIDAALATLSAPKMAERARARTGQLPIGREIVVDEMALLAAAPPAGLLVGSETWLCLTASLAAAEKTDTKLTALLGDRRPHRAQNLVEDADLKQDDGYAMLQGLVDRGLLIASEM